MTDRTLRFVQFSARLTGWSPFDLWATGMPDDYLAAVDARLPPGLLDDLLAVEGGEEGGEDAVMDNPRLGPLARNLILLWYTGSWTTLAGVPPDFDQRPGVVSPSAYRAGLMWRAAGAHPAGADQQGFGAWSLKPEALS